MSDHKICQKLQLFLLTFTVQAECETLEDAWLSFLLPEQVRSILPFTKRHSGVDRHFERCTSQISSDSGDLLSDTPEAQH